MRKLILYIIIAFNALAASSANLIVLADSAYSTENYTEAIKLYTKSIETDGVSSSAYFNLGNAYFKTGNIGRAIINYERALKIDPSNQDARTNLQFVNTRIQDKPEDDSSFLGNLYNTILSKYSPNAWAWIALISFIVVLGLIALYIFGQHISARKIGFFGSIVMIVFTAFLVSFAYSSASEYNNHDTAIVIVPSTNLSSAPRAPKSKTEKVVPIHEGTKVTIVDSVATPADPSSRMWYDVKINNSTRAWVRSADVERI
jgi:tetratricopeptide (TPR) repeat protein